MNNEQSRKAFEECLKLHPLTMNDFIKELMFLSFLWGQEQRESGECCNDIRLDSIAQMYLAIATSYCALDAEHWELRSLARRMHDALKDTYPFDTKHIHLLIQEADAFFRTGVKVGEQLLRPAQKISAQQSAARKEFLLSTDSADVPLPEYGIDTANHAGVRVKGYTADQMREYAAKALAAHNLTSTVIRESRNTEFDSQPHSNPMYTSEGYNAIRQGYEIKATDDYFAARPQLDNDHNKRIFEAGFSRGFDACVFNCEHFSGQQSDLPAVGLWDRSGQPQSHQEPVAIVQSWTNGSYHRNYKLEWLKEVDVGAKLFTRPQPAIPEGYPSKFYQDGWAKGVAYAKAQAIPVVQQALSDIDKTGYVLSDTVTSMRAMIAAAQGGEND